MAKVEKFRIAGEVDYRYRVELTEEEMDLLKLLMLEGITNKKNNLKRREPLQLFNELCGRP